MIITGVLANDNESKNKKISKKEKLIVNNSELNNSKVIKYVFVGILLLLGIFGSGMFGYLNYKQNVLIADLKRVSKKTLAPVSILTPIPVPNIKNVTPKTIPIIDDPIINCNIHTNCGGGTKQMKLSECNVSTCCSRSPNCGGGAFLTTMSKCSNSICCQVDGSWSTYPSKEKCEQAQQGRESNTVVDCPLKTGAVKLTQASCDQAIYDEVYNDTYKALGGGTTPTYIPEPTEDPSITQQLIQRCLDQASSNYNSAKNDCYNIARAYGITSSSWTQQCIQTATENYDYARSSCK